MDELTPAQRWVWIGLLLLAGDSAFEGQVSITKRKGYTTEQLADLLDVTVSAMDKGLQKMQEVGKIKLLSGNVIKISKWEKYQSEYNRQRKYRQKANEEGSVPQEESYNQKLQPKVTP